MSEMMPVLVGWSLGIIGTTVAFGVGWIVVQRCRVGKGPP
jgi:hypothetical protein